MTLKPIIPQLHNIKFDRKEIQTESKIERIIKEYYNWLDLEDFKIINNQSDFEKELLKQEKCDFSYSFFNCDISLEKRNITQEIIFSNSIFAGKLFCYKSIFERPVDFSSIITLDNICFDSSKFKESVSFSFAKILSGCSFSTAFFYKSVVFYHANFHCDVYFDFNEQKSKNLKLGKQNKSNMYFEDATFHRKAIFHNRKFGSTRLHNTKFKGLADFYGVIFTEEISFYKTDFIDTTVFSNATFTKKAVFHYTKVEGNMILRDAKFNNGINMAPINFGINGSLNVFNLKIKPFKSSRTAKDIESHSEAWRKISPAHKKETFRILKHEALKRDNKIEALRYHKKEMVAFWNEPLKLNNISDKLLLMLNLISNGFGLWWWCGILFTFSVGYLFYSWLINDWYLCSESWRIGYLKFLLPTHSLNEILKPSNINSSKLLIDILGRIAVGFGIYQTVQAFRKYGRW